MYTSVGSAPSMKESISRETAMHWWHRCVSCSEASMTTQMRGFGINEPAYEQAIHVFSGGFMHTGHACGLLTGAILAAGFVARARFDDDRARSGAALHAAIQLARAHPQLTGSVNCLEITEVSLTQLSGRLRYLQQGKGRMCSHLHLNWAPQAQQLIDKSLVEYKDCKQAGSCANCAVRTLRELVPTVGMKAGDSVLVAGFAGGVGLCGNVCGALAAGVFAMSVGHQLGRKQKKRDSRIRGSLEELFGANYRGTATRLRLAFVQQFGSELCSDIIGRHFQDAGDHSMFMEQGRCDNVTKFVADWVAGHSAKE
ncbi:MAG: C-GCAxxG-C-C family (seleno)protein [Candidatus Scalindua sp.]